MSRHPLRPRRPAQGPPKLRTHRFVHPQGNQSRSRYARSRAPEFKAARKPPNLTARIKSSLARYLRRAHGRSIESPASSGPISAASPKPSTANATVSETHARLFQQMVEPRTNIAWYLPKAYAAKLLPIFAQIDQWFYIQAQSKADSDGIQATQGSTSQDRTTAPKRPPQSRDG